MSDFKVERLDHVELFVPDRFEAARWYERVLGLEIVPRYRHWSADFGPLMISSDGGSTMLALFEGRPRGARETAGFHRVAFRVGGPVFLAFLVRLRSEPLYDQHERRVRPRDVTDFGGAISVFFCDPWGHLLEVTTYDYEWVKERLEA
jgi:catechol 2,3-dioxygenase-like lactoylglutathione lyase family enzyme